MPGSPGISMSAVLSSVIFLHLALSPCRGETPLGSALQRNETLGELFSEYFQWKLKTYPEWATLEGQPGYNHLVEDFSLEAITKKVEKCQEFYDRSRKLSASSEDEKLYKHILEVKRATNKDGAFYCSILLFRLNCFPALMDSSTRDICFLQSISWKESRQHIPDWCRRRKRRGWGA